MKQGIILFCAIMISILSYSQNASSLNKSAADAIKNKNEEKALDLYLQALKLDPKNVDALCGASLMSARVGARSSSSSLQKSYYKVAKIYAETALKVAPTNDDANYVMSVAMGRMALISGSKEKVAASRDIKKYADLAIKYNPNNAGAWHVLGRWNFGVATLNFAEKAAANALFGGIPKGDLNTAIKCFLKSIQLDPGYLLNYTEIAKTYHELGDKASAAKYLKVALGKPSLMEDDEKIKKNVMLYWLNLNNTKIEFDCK